MTINGSSMIPQVIGSIGSEIFKNANDTGLLGSSTGFPFIDTVQQLSGFSSTMSNSTTSMKSTTATPSEDVANSIDNYSSSNLESMWRGTAGGVLDFGGDNYTTDVRFIDDPFNICSNWLPVNHIYFQLANTFLLLSYLAPNGIYGILYLRVTLAIGCVFFSMWGWLVLCAFDTFLWNAIFVVINTVHVIIICYCLRPVRFSSEVEQVYEGLFQPLKVSRHQFKKALSCMKQIKQVKFQEIYAQEKITRVDSLSLVLSGRLVISQNGRALHIVSQHQFLDSPEWFGVSTDEFFQVTATAIEDARILIWHRDKLKLSIMSDQFLQAVFDHILGRDVVKKLMQLLIVVRGDSAVLKRRIKRLLCRGPDLESPLLNAFQLLAPQLHVDQWGAGSEEESSEPIQS